MPTLTVPVQVQNFGSGRYGRTIENDGFLLGEEAGDRSINEGRSGGKDQIAPGDRLIGHGLRLNSDAVDCLSNIFGIQIDNSELTVSCKGFEKSRLKADQDDLLFCADNGMQSTGAFLWFSIFTMDGFLTKAEMPVDRVQAGYEAGAYFVRAELDIQQIVNRIQHVFELIAECLSAASFKFGLDHQLFPSNNRVIVVFRRTDCFSR